MRAAAALITLAIILLVSAVNPIAQERVSVVVAVTAPSLTEVVECVGGRYVEVLELVPPGADPHTYDPPLNELLSKLSRADLVVMTGPSHLVIEEKVRELEEQGMISVRIVDYTDYIAEGMTLLNNPITGKPNPHGYIFSYAGLKAIAKALAKALAAEKPELRDYFQERAESFINILAKEEFVVQGMSSSAPRIGLLTPILQYAAADAGIGVGALMLPELGVEASQQQIDDFIDKWREGLFDVVVTTDMEASRLGKVVDALKAAGIPVAIIPISTLKSSPHLIPVALVTAAGSVSRPGPSSPAYLMVIATAVGEALVIVILAYFLYLCRRSLARAVIGHE